MNARTLMLDRTDAWAIHDCLQSQLQGFSGRHETAEPWHALGVLAKLRPLLVAFEQPGAQPQQAITLTRGELECIDLNVPRTAYQGGTALLLRVFHALEELDFAFPLLGEEPDRTVAEARLASWQGGDSTDPAGQASKGR